jgi:hypothetical protein
MTIKVLGISTSPRTPSNSDLLLRQGLAGAFSAGAQAEHLYLADYKINPCIECNKCNTTGRCVIKDDYEQVLKKMLDADRLIFASPVFFMSVCSQAKILIDRTQCLWVHKHLLGKKPFDIERDRRAMIIAVGGSKSIKQFDNVRSTMKAYFDSLGFKYVSGLFVNRIDAAGAVEKHPGALQEAFRLGCLLAAPDSPLPHKPIETEIT